MKKFLLALCFGLIMASNALAQVRIDGTEMPLTDNCYTVPETKSVESVEIESGSTLIIPNGVALTVTGTVKSPAVTCLIIEEGGQLINGINGSDGSSNINGQIKIHVNAYDNVNNQGWYSLSVPLYTSNNKIDFSSVENLIVNDQGEPAYDLFRYRENHPSLQWQSALATAQPKFTYLEMGRGYLYASTIDNDRIAKGQLQYKGQVSTNLTCLSSNVDLKGLNLIGNPYPHSIYKGYDEINNMGCAISSTSFATGYYTITNSGNWEPHIDDDEIKPFVGILVKLTSSLPSGWTIQKRLNAPSSASKDGNDKPLQINVMGSSEQDRAFVYFNKGNGLNKIDHLSDLVPNLSVLYDNKKYAIAHVGDQCNSLDVLFKNSQAGFFTLSVDNSETNFNYLHLIDNFTGEEIDLLEEPNYKFYAFGNEEDGRFRIVLNPNSLDSEESEFAYISNGEIIITGLNGNATLQMFDVMGRLVGEEVINGTSGMICRAHKPNTTGVYVLRMMANGDIKTQKLIVE